MAVQQPGPDSRWRCTLCGNLTRFDVMRVTRTEDFVHVDLAGTPTVDEQTVLDDRVEHVTCRWCKAVDQVELVPRPGAEEPPSGGIVGPPP
ncbi:MAG TPA: hypothetical protein VNA30_07375 [Mycobacteriales bacterium]|nr:hypothetical protein [Mycobacteriales bacterium]